MGTQHSDSLTERHLKTLQAVAEILQYPYKSVETEEELVKFERNIKAAAANKMQCIGDMHSQIVLLVNAVGIESEHPDFISGHKTALALEKIKSYQIRLKSLREEVDSLVDERDAFEKCLHDETDSNNRLLEKIGLYRDVLRDWISAARASQRGRGFFRKLFRIASPINDEDRAYAAKETDVIQNQINDAVKPE